jgi:hypothetical protein
VADVIFVAILVAFFALAALFVRACDGIIGAEEEGARGTAPDDMAEAA